MASLGHSLVEGGRKSAPKIESKLQVIGTEGSMSGTSVREMIQAASPLWESSTHCMSIFRVGKPGGQWPRQLDKPCIHHHQLKHRNKSKPLPPS